MRSIWIASLLLAGCSAPGPYDLPPRDHGLPPATGAMDTTPPIEAEPVGIVSADFDSSRVRLRVPSTRCTQASDFLPRTRRSQNIAGAVQLILTRVRPDPCPSRPAGTKLLEYWLHAIDIRPGDNVRILNPFVPGAASWPEPAGGLEFLVEPRTTRAGAAVTLILRNNFPHGVGYNLCMSGLEQRQGGTWRTVPQDGVCTRQLNVVQARGEGRYETRLPPSLSPGEYRFSTRVEEPLNTAGMKPILSETFYVRP